MTTVLVVKKAGRICIAADTLARFGSQRESDRTIVNSDKIIRVGDCFLAPTGPASSQLVLRSYFSEEREPDFSNIDAIFETMRQLHAVLKDEYFLNPKEDDEQPFESSQMDCLIAGPAGIFGVYSLRSIQEYRRFYAFGSGSEYALGALEALYELDFGAEELARRALSAAAEFDSATDLPMTCYSVEERTGGDGNEPGLFA